MIRTGCLRFAGLAVLAGLSFHSESLLAQADVASPCKTYLGSLDEGGAEVLQIVCGNAAAVLGQVDDYELVDLPALDAAIVVTTLNQSRRVWLAMPDGDKALILEELTGTMARAAGRGATANIEGIDLNLDQIAAGQLAASVVSQQSGIASEAVQGSDAVANVDFAKLVARARATHGEDTSGSAN